MVQAAQSMGKHSVRARNGKRGEQENDTNLLGEFDFIVAPSKRGQELDRPWGVDHQAVDQKRWADGVSGF